VINFQSPLFCSISQVVILQKSKKCWSSKRNLAAKPFPFDISCSSHRNEFNHCTFNHSHYDLVLFKSFEHRNFALTYGPPKSHFLRFHKSRPSNARSEPYYIVTVSYQLLDLPHTLSEKIISLPLHTSDFHTEEDWKKHPKSLFFSLFSEGWKIVTQKIAPSQKWHHVSKNDDENKETGSFLLFNAYKAWQLSL